MPEYIVSIYNSLFTTANLMYIFYVLNKEHTSNPKVRIPIAIITGAVIMQIFTLLFPERAPSTSVIISLGVFISVSVFIIRNDYFTAIVNTAFSILCMGISEILVMVIYVLPMKISIDQYNISLKHNTIGCIIIILSSVLIMKLFSKKLIKIREFALHKNKKLMLIFAVDVTILPLLLGFYDNFMIVFLSIPDVIIMRFKSLIVISYAFCGVFILAIINYFLISKLKYKEILENSSLDDLTKVLNRKYGLEYLEKQLKFCQRRKQPLTICYIDINNLKYVNDTFGHKTGDDWIVSIIQEIRKNIRHTDQITRLGGDEFLVIFPSYRKQEAEVIATRVLNCLEEAGPELYHNRHCSFSYGFAETSEDQIEILEDLIARADKEMYQCKEEFRQKVCVG